MCCESLKIESSAAEVLGTSGPARTCYTETVCTTIQSPLPRQSDLLGQGFWEALANWLQSGARVELSGARSVPGFVALAPLKHYTYQPQCPLGSTVPGLVALAPLKLSLPGPNAEPPPAVPGFVALAPLKPFEAQGVAGGFLAVPGFVALAPLKHLLRRVAIVDPFPFQGL